MFTYTSLDWHMFLFLLGKYLAMELQNYMGKYMFLRNCQIVFWASLMAQQVKNPLEVQETQEIRFSPWVGKLPSRRKMAKPFQYSCLENPLDRGA